jgi:hypothetical protein
MLLDVGGLAVSVVTLILQRLDRRRDAVRHAPDLQHALLTLSELLGRWVHAATWTNTRLQAPRGPDSPGDIDRALVGQGVLSRYAVDWVKEEGDDGLPSAQAVLATYAPELRKMFSDLIEARARLVADIRETLSGSPETSSKPAEAVRAELVSTLEGLKQAKAALDAFIRETFPPGSVRVSG